MGRTVTMCMCDDGGDHSHDYGKCDTYYIFSSYDIPLKKIKKWYSDMVQSFTIRQLLEELNEYRDECITLQAKLENDDLSDEDDDTVEGVTTWFRVLSAALAYMSTHVELSDDRSQVHVMMS